MDDFIYFSFLNAIERRFETILSSQIKVKFMGVVTWFLGIHFTWADKPDRHLGIHLSQVAYAQNLVERYRQHTINYNSQTTPYRSGLPINSILPAQELEDDPVFLRRKLQYQSLVGSLNWLATTTRPDISPVTSFLAAHANRPSQTHMDSGISVVKYLRSTADYGIAFHSHASSPAAGYIHFPFHHDIEAFKDALPPTAAEHHCLTAYSDACWGSQLGSSVSPGTEIEMYKLRSMSGYIVLRGGGPIAWSAIRQERTSRSSCEAEVRATDECAKEVLSIRSRGLDIGLTDSFSPTPIFNDNQGCVDWCKTTTTTGMKHLNLCENAIRERVLNGTLTIHHIPGKLNCSDIFTKELKDTTHFCLLRDSFMLDQTTFLLGTQSTHDTAPALPPTLGHACSAVLRAHNRCSPNFYLS